MVRFELRPALRKSLWAWEFSFYYGPSQNSSLSLLQLLRQANFLFIVNLTSGSVSSFIRVLTQPLTFNSSPFQLPRLPTTAQLQKPSKVFNKSPKERKKSFFEAKVEKNPILRFFVCWLSLRFFSTIDQDLPLVWGSFDWQLEFVICCSGQSQARSSARRGSGVSTPPPRLGCTRTLLQLSCSG